MTSSRLQWGIAVVTAASIHAALLATIQLPRPLVRVRPAEMLLRFADLANEPHAPSAKTSGTVPPSSATRRRTPTVETPEPAADVPSSKTGTPEPSAVVERTEKQRVRVVTSLERRREGAAPPVPRQMARSTQDTTQVESDPKVRATYEQLLASWIDRHKTYPSVARRRRYQGKGLLRVRIRRDGKLLEERLDRSTRYAILDRAALETVRRAAPFPRVPEQLTGEVYEFVVPFVFTLD